jgi:hypothetical protein
MNCDLRLQPLLKTPDSFRPIISQSICDKHSIWTNFAFGDRLAQIRKLLYLVLLFQIPEYHLPFSSRGQDPFRVTRVTLDRGNRENFCVFLSVFHFVTFECHHMVHFITKFMFNFILLYVWVLSFITFEIFARPS